MKTFKIVVLLAFLGISSTSYGQFLDKLGKKAEKAVERTVERRVERETEKSTDRALDSVVEAPKKEKKKEKKKKKEKEKEKKKKNTNVIGTTDTINRQISFREPHARKNETMLLARTRY